ncbi:hypothetical protein JV173_01485 [Acholeplasma equirhinis]|uniref:hypothetical protein n=1 Tax=Acholeplasma equirhinis TaxID=555393 RepID=UPI00197AAB07|nr:hypothetical protein [Acholeplasma equirhinis]MBN3490176.1 hypothetical protein [Acholeplasma equirhinis]
MTETLTLSKTAGIKLTYADALELISWEDLAKLLLSTKELTLMHDTIKTFMNRKHRVNQGVLNAVLVKAVITAKRVHGEHQTINEAYLRLTFESFVLDENKKIIINTAEQAINKLTKDIEMLRSMRKNKKDNSPDWVKQYVDELPGYEIDARYAHDPKRANNPPWLNDYLDELDNQEDEL